MYLLTVFCKYCKRKLVDKTLFDRGSCNFCEEIMQKLAPEKDSKFLSAFKRYIQRYRGEGSLNFFTHSIDNFTQKDLESMFRFIIRNDIFNDTRSEMIDDIYSLLQIDQHHSSASIFNTAVNELFIRIVDEIVDKMHELNCFSVVKESLRLDAFISSEIEIGGIIRVGFDTLDDIILYDEAHEDNDSLIIPYFRIKTKITKTFERHLSTEIFINGIVLPKVF